MCLHITYIKGERIERCLAIKTCPLNVLHPYKVGTFFPNPESSPLKVWNLSSTLWIILVGFLKMQVNEPFTSFIVASHTILQPRLFLELLELLEPLTLQNRFLALRSVIHEQYHQSKKRVATTDQDDVALQHPCFEMIRGTNIT